MKTLFNYLVRILCMMLILSATTFVSAEDHEPKKLDNPISVEYLKKNLRKSQPRLVLNSKIEKSLKKSLKTDPVVQNMYKAIQLNAEEIFGEPLLTRNVVG